MRVRPCALSTLWFRVFRAASKESDVSGLAASWVLAAPAMGKTVGSLGQGTRPDPVRSFNRWKKKHSHRQHQKKERRKQLKKPEWQVEREGISRLVQNYEKVRWPLGAFGGSEGGRRREVSPLWWSSGKGGMGKGRTRPARPH